MFAAYQRMVGDGKKTVEFECKCGNRQPIWNLFFCHTATEFVCERCSIKEIDTYFSPSLLISTLSNSAYQDYNRCSRECDCPVCGSTLQSRMVEKKQFIFSCEFCRWDSTEVGLVKPDSLELIKAVRDQEFPHQEEFNKAVRALQLEKGHENNFETTTAAIEEGETALGDDEKALASAPPGKLKPRLQNIEEQLEKFRMRHFSLPPKREHKQEPLVDPIDEDHSASDLTTVTQRLLYPGTQPTLVSNLYPRRKSLMTKIAHRCPTSQKYVIKPKIGAAHISFDKCHLAVHVVPKITMSLPSTPLVEGRKSEIVLFFKNPVNTPVKLRMASLMTQPNSGGTKGKSASDAKDSGKRTAAPLATEPSTQATVMVKEFEIPRYDDIAEDIMHLRPETQEKQKNGMITFGKLSKVGIPVTIIPHGNLDGEICFSLGIVMQPQPVDGVVSRVSFKHFSYVVHFNLGELES